ELHENGSISPSRHVSLHILIRFLTFLEVEKTSFDVPRATLHQLSAFVNVLKAGQNFIPTNFRDFNISQIQAFRLVPWLLFLWILIVLPSIDSIPMLSIVGSNIVVGAGVVTSV
ncbi:hypothetical protein PIB30_104528, partial [Stylosanthes scabra]|nr:hypothetical protein [Stylosanthes scabra]